MSRLPSAETELRHCKSELRKARDLIKYLRDDVETLTSDLSLSTIAAREWKERFDILLKREQPR